MSNPSVNVFADLHGGNGLRIPGVESSGGTGLAVGDAGDLNGDGFSDFLIGAPTTTGESGSSGVVYVVFGSSSGFASDFDLASLDGSHGFRLNGASTGDGFGRSARGVGDFNGDGLSDLIVGAPNFGPGQPAGAAFVVFGSRTSFPSQLNLSMLDGNAGFRIDGSAALDAAGYSVGDAGDINGDGLEDLIVGARSADPGGTNGAGAAYVVFGRAGPSASSFSLSLLDGVNGFKLSGNGAGSFAGSAVRGAGDVNGDGFDDLLVGAPDASPGGLTQSGAVYLVFGKRSGFGPNVDLSTLNGTTGVQFVGVASGDRAGASVSGAGDINGDGFADILIGAPSSTQGAGAAYVVFGRNATFASQFSLAGLNGTDGFHLTGESTGDNAGRSVDRAGDINADGVDDILVGAHQNDTSGTSSGSVYVLYGSRNGFGNSIGLGMLAGTVGFKLAGTASGDLAGRAVSGAGDVNGDGFADLLVGANGADGTVADTGAAYVLFGGDFTGFAGTVGTSGDDSVLAGGGATVVYAGAGNDRIEISPIGLLRVDGGGGADTLVPVGAGALLDLSVLANSQITGIEVIDLELTGSQSLVLAALDLLDLSDSSNSLRITGDGSDLVRLSGAWTAAGLAVVEGTSYTVYRDQGATALIESDIAIAVGQHALAALDGVNGFRMVGAAESDFAGRSVRGAGDVNGDGFDDLIIGAYGADGAALDRLESGASYVVFGRADGIPATIDLALLDGTTGFRLTGVAQLDLSGFDVSGAGDVNGDGLADVLVGAYGAGVSGNQAGAAYVVFGRSNGFESSVDLASLDGENGFAINGASAFDFAGRDVSDAGDINGDGFDDILIGAHGADPNGSFSGSSYVVFGKASGFASSISLSSLDGVTGFKLAGAGAAHASGVSVSSAGDVNGDGFDDLLVGAYFAGLNGSRAGETYLVYGKVGGFAASVQLGLLDGTDGVRIGGGTALDYAGRSVSSGGDINGDGLSDLLIGAYGADPNGAMSGTTYVIFGRLTGFGSFLDVGLLNGANGFAISGAGAGERSGLSVSGAGDVNADGFDDILVGANGETPGRDHTGAAYLVFGRASGFAPSLELAALPADQGLQVIGEATGDEAGRSLGAAGDFNGDGFDDLIIGAYGADPNGLTMAGTAYVLFGGNFTGAVTHPGSAKPDSLAGTDGSDTMLGQQGNDTLAGSGGADVMHGGAGDDLLQGGAGADRLDGGPGRDAAVYTSSSLAVDVDLLIGQVLGGDAVGDLLLSVENLSGSAFNDRLAGDGLANVLDGGAGNDTLTGRDGADILIGGAAFDSLAGGNGDDILRGGEQADTLLGGDGNDYINAGKGTDSVDGGSGNDTLIGALGTDLLIGGDGLDTADYSASTDGVTVSLLISTAQQVSAATGLDTLLQIENLIGSAFNDSLTGSTGNNTLAGGIGTDTLSGDAGFDLLDGGTGDDSIAGGLNADTILGGVGDDWLGGGQGTDSLSGGEGNDTLVGGLGTDRLIGDAGEDHFVFRHALDGVHNIDTFVDLEVGVDVIELSASIFGALAGSIGFKIGTGANLLYHASSGVLAYDPDGAGLAPPVTFAIVGVDTHPALLGNDFLVVA